MTAVEVMIETEGEGQVAEAGLMIVAEMIEAGMTAVEVMIETEGEGQMIEVEGGQMTEADLMTKVGQRIEAVGMTRELNRMTKGGQRVLKIKQLLQIWVNLVLLHLSKSQLIQLEAKVCSQLTEVSDLMVGQFSPDQIFDQCRHQEQYKPKGQCKD